MVDVGTLKQMGMLKSFSSDVLAFICDPCYNRGKIRERSEVVGMFEWLISIEGHEYRVEAENRNGAITMAVNRHLEEVGSVYNRSLLKLMARSRKLAWKEYVKGVATNG